MQRAEVAERIAEMLKRWKYRVTGIHTASIHAENDGTVHVARGLHPQAKKPWRAIQIDVAEPNPVLDEYLGALKNILRDSHPGVKVRLHQIHEFTGSDDLWDRILMLRGRNQGETADQLLRENLAPRTSILIFSDRPFRSDVFKEARRRLRKVFSHPV